MTPTWIPDVSRAVEHLVDHPDRGVFHVASPEVTSPLEFAKELLSALDQHPPELVEGSLRNYLSRSGATPRPVRGGLQCSRLPGSGISLTDWHEGIRRFVEEGGGAR
jgi:dTDP-4-dehydrorhamnose reductase